MKKKRQLVRKLLFTLLILFFGLNAIVAFHAWNFTHFSDTGEQRSDMQETSILKKLEIYLTGAKLPKACTEYWPEDKYHTVLLEGEPNLLAWYQEAPMTGGCVLLCHGYGSEKSQMLLQAKYFRERGYSTLLLDFSASGQSEGTRCSMGYYEAEQVMRAYDLLRSMNHSNILLYGSSMGAVAILKAVHDYQPEVSGLILEAPYSTMLETTKVRFRLMGLPETPMAHLLVFWGGTLNGFNAFSLNSPDYASNIHAPVLLMLGGMDDKVSEWEVDSIASRLKGPAHVRIFPEARHESFLNRYDTAWKNEVSLFLNKYGDNEGFGYICVWQPFERTTENYQVLYEEQTESKRKKWSYTPKTSKEQRDYFNSLQILQLEFDSAEGRFFNQAFNQALQIKKWHYYDLEGRLDSMVTLYPKTGSFHYPTLWVHPVQGPIMTVYGGHIAYYDPLRNRHLLKETVFWFHQYANVLAQ